MQGPPIYATFNLEKASGARSPSWRATSSRRSGRVPILRDCCAVARVLARFQRPARVDSDGPPERGGLNDHAPRIAVSIWAAFSLAPLLVGVML